MILSTPDPPHIPTLALPLPLAGPGLFSVNPGIHAEDALIAAADYLECASAAADEVANSQGIGCRALARSVVHQLDMARVLIEATLAALHQTQVATREDLELGTCGGGERSRVVLAKVRCQQSMRIHNDCWPNLALFWQALSPPATPRSRSR